MFEKVHQMQHKSDPDISEDDDDCCLWTSQGDKG